MPTNSTQTLKPYKQTCQLCNGAGKVKLTSVSIDCPKCQSIKVESNELLIVLTKEIIDLNKEISKVKNDIKNMTKIHFENEENTKCQGK